METQKKYPGPPVYDPNELIRERLTYRYNTHLKRCTVIMVYLRSKISFLVIVFPGRRLIDWASTGGSGIENTFPQGFYELLG